MIWTGLVTNTSLVVSKLWEIGQGSLARCSPWGHKELDTVQFSSVAQSCLTLCDPMNRSTPGLPLHHHLRSSLRLMSIKSVMPSSHLILCHLFFLLPPIPPSIRVFSNESTLHMRWPKHWSFSFSIILSWDQVQPNKKKHNERLSKGCKRIFWGEIKYSCIMSNMSNGKKNY